MGQVVAGIDSFSRDMLNRSCIDWGALIGDTMESIHQSFRGGSGPIRVQAVALVGLKPVFEQLRCFHPE